MKPTEKTKVTPAEYLQLIGLLTLAKHHQEKMGDILLAVQELTGDINDDGHSSDAVFCDHNALDLLKKLGIVIAR